MPKTIINIETNPIVNISLFLETNSVSIGNNKVKIEQITIINRVSLFKNLKVLILGLSSDNFNILGACISNITNEIIAEAPTIEVFIFPSGITKPAKMM